MLLPPWSWEKVFSFFAGQLQDVEPPVVLARFENAVVLPMSFTPCLAHHVEPIISYAILWGPWLVTRTPSPLRRLADKEETSRHRVCNATRRGLRWAMKLWYWILGIKGYQSLSKVIKGYQRLSRFKYRIQWRSSSFSHLHCVTNMV